MAPLALSPVSIDLGRVGHVEGVADPRFQSVVDAFVANFQERGEVGASLAATVAGETVIDIWGGWQDADTGTPWDRDTISIVFSCTKAATALCAHMLIARGLLDLDQPVGDVWQEFASAGKERATVRMMLDHSVGVPAVRPEVRRDGMYDWDYMVSLIEAEEPFWEPGSRNGYHGLTFGWTVGELVRRVTGKSLGTFFREEVAEPLGIDFWIGLPEAHDHRVAEVDNYVYSKDDPMSPFRAALKDRTSIPGLFLLNTGGYMVRRNSREGRAAEVPAAGGMTNARGLAGMYAPLANGGAIERFPARLDQSGASENAQTLESMRKTSSRTDSVRSGFAGGDVRLVDEDTLTAMGEVAVATGDDLTLRMPTRFGLGFMKSMDNRKRTPGEASVILSAPAFGHVGAGGVIGFCDPAERLSFGYTSNRQGPGLLMNPRGQSLIDATYRTLGYVSNAGGVWRK